ncbi:bifunctional methylenetetrahydrofolate dehydrogenase/methenyltetrahydrofolate cyclohydrolase FolD [archaeon]|jgi:methylenetetrahydrofolate dehydrogenase (NADP+) / methenyltetrahydrofolate cyclohydrolase|nr:bifunctional methylenetetrahydrofolate dehydrogenase/methenyltetrahydrofolate cyclohydrolase FolD [archaeon]
MDINGRELSKKIKNEIKDEVDKLDKKPGLAVVLVGENPASKVYVRHKEKACQKVGYFSKKIVLQDNTSEEELLTLIDELNNDNLIHGILVQLPLPKHIDSDKVISSINPNKDVDGFHPLNMGKLMIGQKTIISCTPKGIIELIKSTKIDMNGKNAVVIGRSNIVGKPIALLLLQNNATVTMCHSRTKNLKKHCLDADIIVAAVGIPNFVKEDMVKKDCVIIDVGINRLDDGTLAGDVDYKTVHDKVSFITPVPGGVGPMTIASLMRNTLECYKIIEGIE